ncbi:tRNA (adenine(22)-N(1))-methyltransferase [Paenibacillus radicis (ex Xue et al. 2023)]|uniref:Class I SAM-dependent methyltransferase n=1 Tax=Paenibacillus radicis (ex Xue et al. 2023) TaxID=2972489 RepID=A0ABT1YHH8_9BACL|nr:class I SAM-dependent methyltransferase [Paenibacillus radicis (ex Xue et al. 2023)]MCR8631410.1 class I SAM-dependent methyltransferase [Paenibacillus radicis (ex Xue et al. 2023)]
MLRLSKRLEMIAKQVPEGSRMADIGSDHALLPSYLAERGKISKAVAGEVNLGPYQAAAKQVRDAVLGSLIDVRLGDGLAVIQPGEVDVITIAGMGGALIAAILEAGQDKLAGVSMLILQPNVGESFVRTWLLEHSWVLIREQILEEDGKIYEILTAVPAQHTELTNGQLYESRILGAGITANEELQLKLGPYFLQEPSAVWFHKWKLELDKLEMIRGQLARSSQQETRSKEQLIESEIKQIKEVLACLQKDKASFN